MAEWRRFDAVVNILCIGRLVGFVGLTLMIRNVMTNFAHVTALKFKLCPFCM